ncbi:hypothetical protein PCO31111_04509 [Pandoraea communis]|uniref:Helix-turn-helix domain-containing protein n=1 Tax=Pandoraea communis TaxID=2508297 RepID=A0A5E4YFU1_9BURK|nr:YdaS family helix-turn-helix protein [Pandoraea communis]VVE47327.1 hypothetical protein PCO31111_04509 [Pandoraea communis]
MNNLKVFLSPMPKAQREDFARRCGTTYAFLRNVMYGQRVAGEKLAVAIERESCGAVTRRHLRKDWTEIWPELAGGATGESK